jgi:hypothetical protein
MDGTILSQGLFTVQAGVPAVDIAIPSNADIMRVLNYTAAGRVGAGVGAYTVTGVTFDWQRGMVAGTGRVMHHGAGTMVLAEDTFTAGGFTLLDTSLDVAGPTFATMTAISNANPPVVTDANTPALGSVVRLSLAGAGFNQPQLGGLDFTVTAVTPGVNFTIGNINMLSSVAATTGRWTQIPYDPIYYPRKRSVTFVRVAAQAVIYLSVTHQYAVGQKVRLSFPGGIWGDYNALDGVQATITAINVARAGTEPTNAAGDNNIQVNVSTAGFAAWDAAATFGVAGLAYPGAAAVAFTPAAVIPMGEDTAESLTSIIQQVPRQFPDAAGSPAVAGAMTGLLSDSTSNLAYIGMHLGQGGATTVGGALFASGPAGSVAGDVVYWWAGKSSFGGL